MRKFLIICFVCVIGFRYCLNEPLIDPQIEPMHGEPRRLSNYLQRGWTGDQKFQDDYEKAVREYDRKRQALPPGLVLPGGETVQERIDSGRVYGK